MVRPLSGRSPVTSRSAAGRSARNDDYTAYLGHVVSPRGANTWDDYRHGALVVDGDGRIVAVGPWSEVRSGLSGKGRVVDFGKRLILPGFIDLHLHLPQISEVGQTGHTLLGWLKTYIFPAEARFRDPATAAGIATWFFSELARNGTTTAVVFPTIHAEATDAAFKVALERGNRVIMGKVMMDANCPEELTETWQDSLRQSGELARRWHGADGGRLLYAFTPRFAVTSSRELLAGAGKLWSEHPGTYVHTHLAENEDEVNFVSRLFPEARSYTDVYDRFGLIGSNSIYAHSIHLDDLDFARIAEAGASIAHCPSSNFFLKSGVFKYAQARQSGVKFALGSDVAAGPEMSMFRVMKDATYMQLHEWLSPYELFYRATLAGARALNLDDRIGSLTPGKEADFVVVDPTRKPSIVRNLLDQPTEEMLSRLVYLGDDRLIYATYVRGRAIWRAEDFPETSMDLPAETASALVETLLSVAEDTTKEKSKG